MSLTVILMLSLQPEVIRQMRNVSRKPSTFQPNMWVWLGSTKKITAIVNYLQEKWYTSQSLVRLKAPISLDINAQTPSEIAIGILAEIISVKRSLSSTQ